MLRTSTLERTGTGEAGARGAWETIEMDGGQGMLGFGTVADGVWQMARLEAERHHGRLASEHSDAWRELAVAVLHVLVLDHLLAPAMGTKPTCKYVHLLREVTDAAAAKECQLAALVPPATMEHVAGDRRQPGEDAAEIDVLLSEAADRAGVQPTSR